MGGTYPPTGTGRSEHRGYGLPNSAAGWNPMGGGQFRLLDGAVTGVVDDGATAADDPIWAAAVLDAADRVAAKIVDLDTQYQIASELYGLRVRFVAADGVELLSGEFEPAAFRDLGGTGHARFVSVLGDLAWAPPGASGFLDRLRAATSEGMVAIRLTTYAFDGPPTLLGKVVGAVGPHLTGEPRRFVAGRHLRTAGPNELLNDADGLVSDARDRLTVDLSNSLALDGATAVPGDLDIRLGLLTGTTLRAGAAGSSTDASTSSVAGLRLSNVLPDAASTHSPLISILRT